MLSSAKITDPAVILLKVNLGADKQQVIEALAQTLVDSGRANDLQQLLADLAAREAKVPTGLPGGLAVPHCQSTAVKHPTVAFASLSHPVDFGASDGPADLIFMLVFPADSSSEHLTLLARLSRKLMQKDFVTQLRSAASPEQAVELISTAVEAAPPSRRIVAVTSCPTGIAHTYMAAEALEAAAAKLGWEISVETQGAAGMERLEPKKIAAADAVIFAADVGVREQERFSDKKVLRTTVSSAISDAETLLASALKAPIFQSSAASNDVSGQPAANKEHLGIKIKQALLTGVSYMIPFVAAGGILIALGFMIGGWQIDKVAEETVLQNSLWNLPAGGLAQYAGSLVFFIGANSMNFLVPALAGYVAFGIADRPGIAPGFTVGVIAVALKTGYLGGLVGGLLAGAVAYYIANLRTPHWLTGLMPVVVVPLVATIISSGIMILFLSLPIAAFMTALNSWLLSLTGIATFVLGLILGTMMCFDLGGPVNKVAYTFAVAGLAEASVSNQVPYQIMAAVMAAGMVPPLGMALATVLRPKLFCKPEIQNGKSAWLLGAAFISEGAIPFAAADPFRVIGASIMGGAATGAISMVAQVSSPAPHGGIFVALLIGNLPMFLVSIVSGMIITAVAVIVLKTFVCRRPVLSVPVQ